MGRLCFSPPRRIWFSERCFWNHSWVQPACMIVVRRDRDGPGGSEDNQAPDLRAFYPGHGLEDAQVAAEQTELGEEALGGPGGLLHGLPLWRLLSSRERVPGGLQHPCPRRLRQL